MKELVEISEKELEKRIEKAKDVYRIPRKYKMPERLILQVGEKLQKKTKNDVIHEDFYYWKDVCIYQPLAEKFILEHSDKVNWNFVFRYQNLSEQFMLENKDRLHHSMFWSRISSNLHLTEDFIEKYKKELYWNELFEHTQRTEQFIEQYGDITNWYKISLFQNLSEDFILKHQDKIDFGSLVRNVNVAKDFFERNKDKITVKLYAKDLERIVRYQNVSEQTLREIKKGKTVWKAISLGADVSKDFVLENYENINPQYLTWWNKKVSKEVKQEVRMIEKLSGNIRFQ
jgi:hypothetical protein